MCWPYSRARRNPISFGPTRIEIAMEKIAAARTRSISDLDRLDRFGDALEPERARGFDEHGVAGLHDRGEDHERLGDGLDPARPPVVPGAGADRQECGHGG